MSDSVRDADTLRQAADAIASGFVWSSTPEGTGYWSRVICKLKVMIAEAEAEKAAHSVPAVYMGGLPIHVAGCGDPDSCLDPNELLTVMVYYCEDGEYLRDLVDVALPWEVE